MHELSLALGVCRIVEATVGTHRLATVRQVGLEMGERSGIDVASLEFCLETLLSAPPFGTAGIAVTRIPGTDFRVAWLEVEDDDPPD